jgi:hypothetical protein
MISERLRYLAERLADNAARGIPLSPFECHAIAQQLDFYTEMVERMENSTLAPQDEVLEAMVSDAA